MTNLLVNPGFEGRYQPWQGQAEVMLAEGWLPFWVPQSPSDEPWRNRAPAYWPATGSRLVRAGQTAQVCSTPWGTHIGGVMQTISVIPGQRLRLKAHGFAWSTDADTAGQSTDPGNVRMKIGIDPAGGSTPFGSSVVWSVERSVYDQYDAGFTVETIATHPAVTVFLLSAPEMPRKHNDVFWDDASLEVLQDVYLLPAETSSNGLELVFTEATQQVGQPVGVHVACRRLLQNMLVCVSGPEGGVSVRQVGVATDGPGYSWQWEFVPAVAGPYTVTASADGVDAVTTTIRIAGDVTGPELLPPGYSSARGKPRAQYERTYILMPPDANMEWVLAVIESGILMERRWSLGFSRDDAGIGDLDNRTVIAINPDAWPEPVEAWFALWYPGVTVRAVPAASPEELRIALCAADL